MRALAGILFSLSISDAVPGIFFRIELDGTITVRGWRWSTLTLFRPGIPRNSDVPVESVNE
jgi:hypothetical protein